MSLPEKTRRDLETLACQRMRAALQSVTQLMDNPRDVHFMLMSALLTLEDETATHMQDNVAEDGKRLSLKQCHSRVLAGLIVNIKNFGKADVVRFGVGE